MDINQVLKDASKEIGLANSQADLQNLKVSYLGKKGKITELLKSLKDLSLEEKKTVGAQINSLRDSVDSLIKGKLLEIRKNEINSKLLNESIDISFPPPTGLDSKVHPISKTFDEVIHIFGSMGYSVAEGPDIETDFYNFSALNIPEDHPAREMQDTFYIEDQDEENKPFVLRTHTSPVQIRTMEKLKPPLRVIVPGRTYRSDHDATHSPMFHQCEGLVIGDNLNMSHLKGCLIDFCRIFFGVDDLPVRFRPSYFPFTEPSAEVDIGCSRKSGELIIGEGDEWLEILGSGMVNPRVLQNCGLDPNEHQGFAFGMGLERVAMLKYGIPDLRPFFDSDLRWMRHYGFFPFEQTSIHQG